MFSAIHARESPQLGPTLEETLVPGSGWYCPDFYLSALSDPSCTGLPDIEMPGRPPQPSNFGSSGWTGPTHSYTTGSFPSEIWDSGTIDPRLLMQGNASSTKLVPFDCRTPTSLFYNNTFDQPFGESYDVPFNEYDPLETLTPPSLGPSTPDQYDDQVYGSGQVHLLDYAQQGELDFLAPQQASHQLEALIFAPHS